MESVKPKPICDIRADEISISEEEEVVEEADEDLAADDTEEMTKERFARTLETARSGTELAPLISALPNSGAKYGYSLVMNSILKILVMEAKYLCQFGSQCFTTKKLKNTSKSVINTYKKLDTASQSLVNDIISGLTSDDLIWGMIVKVLSIAGCEAFCSDDDVRTGKGSAPANRIACAAHMLLDERVIAILQSVAEAVTPDSRPAMLDNRVATGSTRHDLLYTKLFNEHREWIAEYVNAFSGSRFADDLSFISPNKAVYKDGDDIKAHITKVMNRVHQIEANHKKSGHHEGGDGRIDEVRGTFINSKGKNIDLAIFYAFMMLDGKDLRYVNRRLDEGVGASAGIGGDTGGGLKAPGNSKRKAADAFEKAAVKVMEESSKLHRESNEYIREMLKPIPGPPSSVSSASRGGASLFTPPDDARWSPSEEAAALVKAKKAKLDAEKTHAVAIAAKVTDERRLMWLREKMEYHKFILQSDSFTSEEKAESKTAMFLLLREMHSAPAADAAPVTSLHAPPLFGNFDDDVADQ
jgi:hypothetical protein